VTKTWLNHLKLFLEGRQFIRWDCLTNIEIK
jgi:hypothetical protein